LWKDFYLQHSPVVADNVAFDRQSLERMPDAVTFALSKTETKQSNSPLPRRRSISSSSACKRAVVITSFVAENDSSSLTLMQGQEVLLLEKTSEETWFIASDHKRSFMARVPAKNLKEIELKGLEVRRRRTSRTVPFNPDKRISPLAASSSVAIERPNLETLSACKTDAAAKTGSTSPPTKDDGWKNAAVSPSTPRSRRTFSQERIVFQQQQLLQMQQQCKQSSLGKTEDRSWESMKQQYMTQNRLSPMKKRMSQKQARFPSQPWFSDFVPLIPSPVKNSLNVTVPPSQLVSSLLSPRASSPSKRKISLSLDEGEDAYSQNNGALWTPRRQVQYASSRSSSSNQLVDRRGVPRSPKVSSPKQISPGSPLGSVSPLFSPRVAKNDPDDDTSDDESGDDISLSDSSDDEDYHNPEHNIFANTYGGNKRGTSSFLSSTLPEKSMAGHTAAMFSPRPPPRSSSMRNLLNLFRSSSSKRLNDPNSDKGSRSVIVPVVHGVVPSTKK